MRPTNPSHPNKKRDPMLISDEHVSLGNCGFLRAQGLNGELNDDESP